MRTIIVPKRAELADSYILLARCDEAEKEPDDVTLDCSAVTWFGPMGIALLASTIATRRGDGRKTTVVAPSDDKAKLFATEVGFLRLAAGKKATLGALEVRQFSALDASYTQQVVDLLVDLVPGITESNSYPIQLCLNELLQNVFEWSGSAVGCFVLARYYSGTESVRVAVVDRGIGIPAALRRSRVRDLQKYRDDEVIVQAVTAARLTSRANQVGGLGLKTIREVVCDRGGSLTVISLGAKVSWRGPRVLKARSTHFRGTAIELEFRPDAPFPELVSSPSIF